VRLLRIRFHNRRFCGTNRNPQGKRLDRPWYRCACWCHPTRPLSLPATARHVRRCPPGAPPAKAPPRVLLGGTASIASLGRQTPHIPHPTRRSRGRTRPGPPVERDATSGADYRGSEGCRRVDRLRRPFRASAYRQSHVEKAVLLAAVLAEGTNLGLARMADASRGLGYHHLVNVAQWHINHGNGPARQPTEHRTSGPMNTVYVLRTASRRLAAIRRCGRLRPCPRGNWSGKQP
jgi:hypothetical protein